ncbi:MAG: alpha/beta fold hydrolase [Phycisphaerales bacterium]|nr:alpha/beta fold hydrolase [Phycisphaerales bacterium]
MSINAQCSTGELPSPGGYRIPYIIERSRRQPRTGGFLLLHGLGVDKDEYLGFYRTLSPKLAEAGFDVLRFDFPAHGESKANASSFTLRNCAVDAIVAAEFLLQEIDSSRLHVFGTSFGAGPAIMAASFFQSSLRNATLLAPAISYRELYIEPAHPLRTAKYSDFYRRAVLEGATVPVSDRAALNWRNAIEFAMCDLGHQLSAIASRTAILHGEADSMVPHELSRDLAARYAGIDLTIIPEMDHGYMDHNDETGESERSQHNLRAILRKALR